MNVSRSLIATPNHLMHAGLKEVIVVGSCYIWWQHREVVKGEQVAPPRRTRFSIKALAVNRGRPAKSGTLCESVI